MLAKFACFNLAANVSAVSLLNSGVVIYLSCLSYLYIYHLSNLSTLDFKLGKLPKSTFLEKDDVSIPVTFFFFLLHN